MIQQEKSPIAAALMAVIPGLGHFYLRDTFFAILYFFLFWVAGFAAFLYLQQNGMSKAPLAGFGLIWAYGIYDAYRDCVQHNQEIGGEAADASSVDSTEL